MKKQISRKKKQQVVIQYRPVGGVNSGGHIERLIRSLSDEFRNNEGNEGYS